MLLVSLVCRVIFVLIVVGFGEVCVVSYFTGFIKFIVRLVEVLLSMLVVRSWMW